MPIKRRKLDFDDAKLRETLAALGMTTTGAARFLDKTPKSLTRWSSGHYPVPTEIAMLLALMRLTRISPTRVRKLVGLPPVVIGDAREKE